MPINLQNSENIRSGWPGPPELRGPELGTLVHAIMANRLARDKMTQESIADTIKNVQSQREQQAYLDAAQQAGLLPEGDTGYGGKYGSELARQILAKKAADSLIERRAQLEAGMGGRGRGGSGGGSGSAEPQTVWKDGIEWRPGPGGRWIPMKPAPGTKADVPKLSPTEKGWAAPEIPGLSVNINAPEDTVPLAPDVPPMPTGGSSTAPPSDTASGHAQDYGKPVSDADVEALSWARAHPDDPRSAAILDKLGVPH